jgi:hypothetical protein
MNPAPVVLVTNERIELDLFLDPALWSGSYDRLELWRSRDTEQGPYDALTDNTWMPAVQPPNAPAAPLSPVTGPSVVLSGKTLELLLNEGTPGETDVLVTFTGVDPLTFADAAAQIQAQSAGVLVAYVAGAQLVVSTVAVGVKVTLRVVGGDAAPLLGLPTQEPQSVAFGRDGRLVLQPTQQTYGFVDPNGAPAYWYRWRFYNSTSGLLSDYSLPFRGRVVQGVGPANQVRCYVDLVDVTGAPLYGQEVYIYNAFNGTQVAGFTVAGGGLKLLTDRTGHAEVLLVRGAAVSVAIGGTNLSRDITVPTDPTVTALNMLTGPAGPNDAFTVQQPNIDFAVRRTL